MNRGACAKIGPKSRYNSVEFDEKRIDSHRVWVVDAVELSRASVVRVVAHDDEAPRGYGHWLALDERPVELRYGVLQLLLALLRFTWCRAPQAISQGP